MERIFSILALVASIFVGVYGYMLITKQQTAIDTLGQKVEGLTKTLGETQKAITAVRQDFDALVSLLGGQAPPGAPPAEVDMGKLSDEANAAFLTAYADQDGVTKRPSGLMYRVVKEGPAGGKSPTGKSAITIKYQGAFIDGTIFDQAATPVTYPLDQLIPGWIEALPLMKEGDEWEVVVPYSLGYGEQGRGSIPGKQTLVFKIELVKVEVVSEFGPAPELLELRDSIDNIDAALIHLLAERFKCTKRVGVLKATKGLPAADPAREQRQIARLRNLATEAKLDPEFAEKFLTFIIKEVIRHHEDMQRTERG